MKTSPFAHEWEGGEEDRTSDGANLRAHPFHPHELGKWVSRALDVETNPFAQANFLE